MGTRWRVRAAEAAGLAIPSLMAAAVVAVGLVRPGYDMLSEPLSDLGKRGLPGADLFNLVFFMLGGGLTIVFAAGVRQAARAGPAGWLAFAAVAANGLLLLLAGYFSPDPSSPVDTQRHASASFPLLFTVPAAPLAVALALRRPGARRPRLFSLAMGLLLVSVVGLFFVWPDPAHPRLRWPQPPAVIGAFQRVLFGLQGAWYVGLAAWLLRGRARLPGVGERGGGHGGGRELGRPHPAPASRE